MKFYETNCATKDKILKIAVLTLILAFYGSLLAHKIQLPAADDIARHVKNGEMILQGNFDVLYSNVYSYTEPDYPFINHHWLAGIIFYLLHQAVGWEWLVIFKIIILFAAFGLLFLASTKKADFWLVAIFSIPTILILRERTDLRPEIFSYFFIAAFLYFLIDLKEKPESNKIYWLIPLQILWVNTHIFFIAGPMLVAGFLLEKIILNYKNLRDDALIRKLAVLFAALLAVNLLNPSGVAGALYPLGILNNYGVEISENQPLSYFLRSRPPLDNISITVFQLSALLLALSFLFNLKNKPVFNFLAGIAVTAGGIKMLRLIPLFGLFFLPIVSCNFRANFVRKKINVFFGALFALLLAYLIFLGASGGFSNYNKFGIGLTRQSDDAAEFFKEQKLKGPIFNDFDIGSYLIYYFYPQEKVFVDNRPEAYSASFFEDVYAPAFRKENKWREIFDKHKFNAIFLYQYSEDLAVNQFKYRRIADPKWALVYSDSYAAIFLRNNEENREVINKLRITPANAAEKLKFLLESQNFEDQVAAADTFNLVGRKDLAAEVFLRVVARWTDKGRVWIALGLLEFDKNPSLAALYFEKGIAAGYKTAEAYSFLGMAYKNAGEREKAEKTLRRALKLNPERQDAKELLNAIN